MRVFEGRPYRNFFFFRLLSALNAPVCPYVLTGGCGKSTFPTGFEYWSPAWLHKLTAVVPPNNSTLRGFATFKTRNWTTTFRLYTTCTVYKVLLRWTWIECSIRYHAKCHVVEQNNIYSRHYVRNLNSFCSSDFNRAFYYSENAHARLG